MQGAGPYVPFHQHNLSLPYITLHYLSDTVVLAASYALQSYPGKLLSVFGPGPAPGAVTAVSRSLPGRPPASVRPAVRSVVTEVHSSLGLLLCVPHGSPGTAGGRGPPGTHTISLWPGVGPTPGLTHTLPCPGVPTHRPTWGTTHDAVRPSPRLGRQRCSDSGCLWAACLGFLIWPKENRCPNCLRIS